MKRKITDEQVIEIKEKLVEGLTQKTIAAQYGVSRSLISDIRCGGAHEKIGRTLTRMKTGGQYKTVPLHDPTDGRILSLEAEVAHLKDERLYMKRQIKSAVKTHGLMKEMVSELEGSIEGMKPLPKAPDIDRGPRTDLIEEDLVMHLSDGHHDQIVVPEECGGLEQYDFPISMRRAEVYVDTVLKWTQQTLSPTFRFPTLTILAYGDHTSGEIHGHAQRSYFRNIFKNCFAIGQLHALMIRDLAPYFDAVNVLYVPGNHGRRSNKKDYHGAHDNWDYLVAEMARLHCQHLDNVNFTIPNAFSINLDIAGIGFRIFHGDDIRSNLGCPWYGLQKRVQKILALNGIQGGTRIRYNCCGHFHTPASIGSMDGELLINGPWVGADAYGYNAIEGFTEPSQLLHGVNSKRGITWRLPVQLRSKNEHKGPKRYKISEQNNIVVPG